MADLRLHGTTGQRPIDRFVDETPALVATGGHTSFLQACVRDRVVAEDWLIAIDGNRYSVPFALIGRTEQVVRLGGEWAIHHRGELVAEHPVLAGRGQLSVLPEHGPGAVARNRRQRHTSPRPPAASPALDLSREVEIRDLAIYEELAGAQSLEGGR